MHDWFTDDTPARFEAYGWHVVRDVDGHDPESIKAAIEAALKVGDKPSLLCCKTIIGFGAPHKAGKEESHGAPLGKDELEGARKALDWPHAAFEVPEAIYDGWRANAAGSQQQAQWQQLFDRYAQAHPEAAAELARRSSGALPEGFAAAADEYIAKVQAEGATIASRKASQNAIGAFAPLLPEIIGGSADLAPSNLTQWKASKSVTEADPNANYVHYGVREFGMSAIANGIALHGGFLPFDATFLGVQRLRAQRAAHERADPGARDPRLHPRLDRLRARTARPTSRSSTLPRCATFPTTTCGVRAMPSSRR